MGLQTLIEGPKKPNGSRRGDLALVLTVILAVMRVYEAMAGQPAQAADHEVLTDIATVKTQMVEVMRRLTKLEDKGR